MFVQIVKFKLKPDTTRELFLDLTDQLVAWLKSKDGFIAYELYEGSELWSDRISWHDQSFAQNSLNEFLKTSISKDLLQLVEDGSTSFFGQVVTFAHTESHSPTRRTNGTPRSDAT